MIHFDDGYYARVDDGLYLSKTAMSLWKKGRSLEEIRQHLAIYSVTPGFGCEMFDLLRTKGYRISLGTVVYEKDGFITGRSDLKGYQLYEKPGPYPDDNGFINCSYLMELHYPYSRQSHTGSLDEYIADNIINPMLKDFGMTWTSNRQIGLKSRYGLSPETSLDNGEFRLFFEDGYLDVSLQGIANLIADGKRNIVLSIFKILSRNIDGKEERKMIARLRAASFDPFKFFIQIVREKKKLEEKRNLQLATI